MNNAPDYSPCPLPLPDNTDGTNSSNMIDVRTINLSLQSLYSSLDASQRQLWIYIYKVLSHYLQALYQQHNTQGVLSTYHIAEIARRNYNLAPATLSLLSIIYTYSLAGRSVIYWQDIIKRLAPAQHKAYNRDINILRKAGYIDRPLYHPITGKRTRGKLSGYVTLTPAGLALCRKIDQDIIELMYNLPLTCITGTGTNKKTGTGIANP